MARTFRIGDHVSWNSEAGWVSGTIIAIHTADFNYKGHVHHASEHDPQYEIKSDKTDHIAARRGGALKLLHGKQEFAGHSDYKWLSLFVGANSSCNPGLTIAFARAVFCGGLGVSKRCALHKAALPIQFGR